MLVTHRELHTQWAVLYRGMWNHVTTCGETMGDHVTFEGSCDLWVIMWPLRKIKWLVGGSELCFFLRDHVTGIGSCDFPRDELSSRWSKIYFLPVLGKWKFIVLAVNSGADNWNAEEVATNHQGDNLFTNVTRSGKIQHFAYSIEILLYLASIMSDLQVCQVWASTIMPSRFHLGLLDWGGELR